MEVILQKDLDELGLEGDIVNVAKGYARNFLIPNGIALMSTPQNIKVLEQRRKKIDAKRIKAREAAEAVKQQIEALEINLKHKAGEEGKLYGAVTNKEIAAFMEAHNISIDRKKIVLDTPIKELGEFKATVRIYPEVTGKITIHVAAETEG